MIELCQELRKCDYHWRVHKSMRRRCHQKMRINFGTLARTPGRRQSAHSPQNDRLRPITTISRCEPFRCHYSKYRLQPITVITRSIVRALLRTRAIRRQSFITANVHRRIEGPFAGPDQFGCGAIEMSESTFLPSERVERCHRGNPENALVRKQGLISRGAQLGAHPSGGLTHYRSDEAGMGQEAVSQLYPRGKFRTPSGIDAAKVPVRYERPN